MFLLFNEEKISNIIFTVKLRIILETVIVQIFEMSDRYFYKIFKKNQIIWFLDLILLHIDLNCNDINDL